MITRVVAERLQVPLTRPYAIAGHRWDHVELATFAVESDTGLRGFGQAAPVVEITGETMTACSAALLPPACDWLLGRDPDDPELARELVGRIPGPAARAAVDTALLDLSARTAGQPVCERIGQRCHGDLPTSITIGVLPVRETLLEADEYVARGFRHLKVKIGVDVDEDLERLRQLRRRFGSFIALRVDANMGYDERALHRFVPALADLDLAMLEQPVPRGQDAMLHGLPAAVRQRLVADESVHDDADLERLLGAGCPYAIVNIKLMKCGGPRAAMRLAQRCHAHGLAILWGCMDESVLGIAAALHTAVSCAATRYLDLDGSFDLAADPFAGGFALAADRLATLRQPGFGALPS